MALQRSSVQYIPFSRTLKPSVIQWVRKIDWVIAFDLAMCVKAKQIQWRLANKFSDVVIRMGTFHIALNFLVIIGKKYLNSGLEDLLIENRTHSPLPACINLEWRHPPTHQVTGVVCQTRSLYYQIAANIEITIERNANFFICSFFFVDSEWLECHTGVLAGSGSWLGCCGLISFSCASEGNPEVFFVYDTAAVSNILRVKNRCHHVWFKTGWTTTPLSKMATHVSTRF